MPQFVLPSYRDTPLLYSFSVASHTLSMQKGRKVTRFIDVFLGGCLHRGVPDTGNRGTILPTRFGETSPGKFY